MLIPSPNGIVTLLTDFGPRDPYVGIVKGMVKRHYAKADLLDICHAVPPQDVGVGAFFLAAAANRFPPGTVHVAVVDPGVGTSRSVLAAFASDCFWIGPDNGLLCGVIARAAGPVEVRSVDLDAVGLVADSHTFHARDIFGPLGGMLASGRFGFRAVGPRVDNYESIDGLEDRGPLVVMVDHFGNLITGISANEVRERGIRAVEVKGQRVPVCQTYSDVGAGELVALVNSYDMLEVACSLGSAARALDAGPGEAVAVVEEGPA